MINVQPTYFYNIVYVHRLMDIQLVYPLYGRPILCKCLRFDK